MSDIQWFPFDIQAFTADTLRMHAFAKGPYLMLLLDYYQHGNGCSTDVDSLLSVCGLDAESWQRFGPQIMRQFEVRNNCIYHERVEIEIAKILTQRKNKSKAGKASAEARQKTQHNGNRKPTAVQQEPQQKVNTEATNNNNNISKKERSPDGLPKKEDPPDGGAPPGFPKPMPSDFTLNPDDLIRCLNDGADPPWVWNVFENWKSMCLETGSLQLDWKASWWRRWEKSKPKEPMPDPPPARAKPRLVVTGGGPAARKTLLPADWQPNASNAAICADEGYDLDAMAQHFRDVCGANGYRYIDHHKAFSNFIRNQKNFSRGNSHGKIAATGHRGSIVDAGNQALAELDRRIEAARAAEAGDQGGDPPVPELPED